MNEQGTDESDTGRATFNWDVLTIVLAVVEIERRHLDDEYNNA